MSTVESDSRSASPVSIIGIVLLGAIVVVAVYFRFAGLNWDENQHLHPDERFLTMVETGLQPIGTPPEQLGSPPIGREQLRDCKEWGGYFDTACSPLNPVNRGYGYYVYGTLPIFLVRYVAEAINQTGYDQVNLVGRMLSALADILTLLLLFAIAHRLYGEKVALLAAAFFAAAALPIQQSHFFTVDNFAVLFGVTTFYFAVRAQQEGRWRDFAAAGLALGTAVACKISVWPLAGLVTLSTVLWWSGGPRRPLESALFKLALAGMLAMLAFRVFQPYAFTGPNFWNVTLDPGWRSTMESIQKLINGEQDAPYAHQWAYRAPILFSWLNMVVWGMGLPLGLAVWVGWAGVAWQIMRKRDWRIHMLPWLWATVFFIYQSTQWTKSIRYLLPVYPFFCLLAAWTLANLKFKTLAPALSRRDNASAGVSDLRLQTANRKSLAPALSKGLARSAGPFGGVATLLTVVVLVGAFGWAWGITRIYAQPVTRATASRWIYQNVPTAATLRYQTDSGEQTLQLTMAPEVTFADKPYIAGFKLPVPGTLSSITLNKLSDPAADDGAETFRVIISQDVSGENPLAQSELSIHLEQAPAGGGSYLFQLPPIALQANQPYFFVGQAIQGGPIVARSSALGNEHWDDAIPLRVDGHDGFSMYRSVQFLNYNEDDPNKLADLVNWLSQTDYICLTSNRLYGGIPRLPTRYPLTSEYYRALFSGELGFEKIAEFTSYITLGPFEFPDQESTEMLGLPNPFDRASERIPIVLPPAEEAFSVYDHPRVVIYRKTADFSPIKVSQILGRFDLSQTIRLWPKQATAAPTALMLDAGVWDKQQQSGTWSALYDRDSLLNRFPLLAILAWWLLLAVLGLLAWPVMAFAWPELPDRGWGLARTLGLLSVGYLAWLAASLRLLTFARGTLLVAMLILAAASASLATRLGQGVRAIVKSHWRLWLIEEAVFAAVFAIFLLIRYGNGDLWHFYMGGERPMDFAYLNAVLKSVYFPPYDPWFSGGQMNYYYFGFVLVSVPIKLLGTVPALAYNIALPLLAALTATGAFSVAFNLSQISPSPTEGSGRPGRHAVGIGVLAALFVVFMGNLGELKLILDGLAQLGQSSFRSTIPGLAYTLSWMRGLVALIGGQAFPGRSDWWYWNASRLMTNGEINEFPFFTFLYSDMHAHMIAFPLTVLMVGIGLGWALRHKWTSAGTALSVLISALVVGVARANNTWDYPTYLAIAFIGLFAGGLRLADDQDPHRPRLHGSPLPGALVSAAVGLALFGAAWILGGINDIPTFVAIAASLFVISQLAHRLLEQYTGQTSWRWIDAAYMAVMGLSILYYHPYIEHYATAYSNAEMWKGARTPLNIYILIHGIFVFPLATYLIAQVRRLGWRWFAAAAAVSLRPWFSFWREAVALFAIVVLIAWLALAALGYGIILIAGPLMVLAALVAIRPRMSAAQRYTVLLAFMAAAITFAVEVIVLRGDVGRMNTVFKFYLQVWIIWGIAAAVMIGWLGRLAARRWQPDAWLSWRIAMIALVASGLMYPLFATRAKLNDRFDASLGPTLDAMEYMTLAQANEQGQDYSFADEYDALIWMQDNIQGTPVVAESASAPEYRSLRNRVSTYTGLPALIGYNYHQRQQRSILPGETIDRRVTDTNDLYATLDTARALKIIEQYGIGYILAGYPERLYYPPLGLAKFDQMVDAGQLHVAYTNRAVTIYEVVR